MGCPPDSAASAQGSQEPSKIFTAQALPPQVGLSTLSHHSLKPLLQHPYTGGPWEPQHWGIRGGHRGQQGEVRGGRLAHQAGRWGRLAEASMYGDPTLREAAPTPPSHPWTSPAPSCCPVWCPGPSSLGSSWGWGDAGRPGAEGDTSGLPGLRDPALPCSRPLPVWEGSLLCPTGLRGPLVFTGCG